VFEGDRYCENCGRDLARPRSDRRLHPIARMYEPADYALMLSAASPVGLLLRPPYSVLPAGLGIALSAWCLARIGRSGGRLKGMKESLWGVALGVLWLVLILCAQGR